jgi:hypothetical protein
MQHNIFKNMAQKFNFIINKFVYLKLYIKMYRKMGFFVPNCATCAGLCRIKKCKCGTPKSLIIIILILLVPFVPLFSSN